MLRLPDVAWVPPHDAPQLVFGQPTAALLLLLFDVSAVPLQDQFELLAGERPTAVCAGSRFGSLDEGRPKGDIDLVAMLCPIPLDRLGVRFGALRLLIRHLTDRTESDRDRVAREHRQEAVGSVLEPATERSDIPGEKYPVLGPKGGP